MQPTTRVYNQSAYQTTYLEAGEGKKTILFLHGFPMSKSIWSSLIEKLDDSYRCIAPDLSGYGSSLPVSNQQPSIDSYADDIAQFSSTVIQEPVIVVGISMGGMIALAIAARYPELLQGLILLHTSQQADDEESKLSRDQSMADILTNGRDRFAREFTARILSKKAAPSVRARCLTMMENTCYETLISGLIALRDRPDRTDALENIEVPALVVAGRDDERSTPTDMKEMANLITHSHFETLAGVSHLSAIEDPDQLARCLRQWIAKEF